MVDNSVYFLFDDVLLVSIIGLFSVGFVLLYFVSV